jgi:WhiB family redox-sensing transcriptional regulator
MLVVATTDPSENPCNTGSPNVVWDDVAVNGCSLSTYVNIFTIAARRHTVALTWSRSIDWDIDDWREQASCRDTDPDLFFPVGTTGPAIEQIESAKAVCFACLAREACLEFALATNQESGIWGATSEDERRKLRKSWLANQRRAS